MDVTTSLPKWFPAARVEEYYGLPKGTIRGWIFSGRLLASDEYQKHGRDWWVKVKAVERSIREISKE
jgi:hypothetical protein